MPVVASYEMGWAKSGRAMNSTYSIGVMGGLHSGKVLGHLKVGRRGAGPAKLQREMGECLKSMTVVATG